MKLSINRLYCIFTVLYWLIITIGLIIFGLSFQKVPINSYGLRLNYFSSQIDKDTYPAGNYYKQFGNYFVTFPSSKVYLRDLRLNVTNKNMQSVGVQYTLVYRLIPGQVYQMYREFSDQYQQSIVAIVNSIISKQFAKLSQEQTRVTAQPQIIKAVSEQFGNKLSNLNKYVQIQALWLNSLDFYAAESDYEKAYLYASSYSSAYQKMKIELQKTNLRIQALRNLMRATKQEQLLELEGIIMEKSRNYTYEADSKAAEKEVFLSEAAKVSQIFQFYQQPKFVLV